MEKKKALFVGDVESDFHLLLDLLAGNEICFQWDLEWSDSYSRAVNAMLKREFDLFIVHEGLEGESTESLFYETYKSNAGVACIILYESAASIAIDQALPHGVMDYLIKSELNAQLLKRSMRYAYTHIRELEELKDKERTFRTIFDRSSDPMIITDKDGRITDANRAMQFFLGYSNYDIVGNNLSVYYSDAQQYATFLSCLEVQGEVKDFKIFLSDSRGGNKCCNISTYIKIAQHGEEAQFFSVFKDIEDRNACLHCEFQGNRVSMSIMSEMANPFECLRCAMEGLFYAPENIRLWEKIRENSLLLLEKSDLALLKLNMGENVVSTQ